LLGSQKGVRLNNRNRKGSPTIAGGSNCVPRAQGGAFRGKEKVVSADVESRERRPAKPRGGRKGQSARLDVRKGEAKRREVGGRRKKGKK